MNGYKKFASILDFPKPSIDETVFDPSNDFKLYPEHKAQILTKLFDYLNSVGYVHYDEWILTGRIVGSMTSWRYSSFSDLDTHMIIDFDKFMQLEKVKDKEIAQEKLDDVLKYLNNENSQKLGSTRHPIEYFFEDVNEMTTDEINRLNIKKVGKKAEIKDGEYSFTTNDLTTKNDKWTIPPRHISADYDYEEVYKNIIPIVEETLEEFDISLGKIDRKITQIEYLDDSFKAFNTEQRNIFKDKIEKKLDEIEKEIHEMIKMGEEAHDKRNEEYKEENFEEGGIGNLTFKCLQKFGYVWIYTKLRELLKEEKEVTTKNVEEVKDIVNTRKESKMNWLKKYAEEKKKGLKSTEEILEEMANRPTDELAHDLNIDYYAAVLLKKLIKKGLDVKGKIKTNSLKRKADDKSVPVEALRKYISGMIKDTIDRGDKVTEDEVMEWIKGDIDAYIDIPNLIEEIESSLRVEEES